MNISGSTTPTPATRLGVCGCVSQVGSFPGDCFLVQDAEGRNRPPLVSEPAPSLAGKGKAV